MRAHWTCVALLFSSLSQPAWSANANLVMQAGLDTSLSLRCDTTLSFGVWFVPAGNRAGGASTLRITPSQPGQAPTVMVATGMATAAGNTTTQAECTLSGSKAADGTEVSISFGVSSIPLNPASVLEQGMASTPASLNLQRLRFRPLAAGFPSENVPPQIQHGSAAFAVGADLVIPNDLDSTQFGGYAGVLTITVTEQVSP